MASSKLPRSILLALGIVACPKGRRPETGPCLDVAPPPEESEDTGAPPPELAPCLKYAPPIEDSGEPSGL